MYRAFFLFPTAKILVVVGIEEIVRETVLLICVQKAVGDATQQSFDTLCTWMRAACGYTRVRLLMTNSPGSMAREEPRRRFMTSVVSLSEGRRSTGSY